MVQYGTQYLYVITVHGTLESSKCVLGLLYLNINAQCMHGMDAVRFATSGTYAEVAKRFVVCGHVPMINQGHKYVVCQGSCERVLWLPR